MSDATPPRPRVLHTEPSAYAPQARQTVEAVGDVDWIACATQEDLRARLAARPYEALFVRVGLGVGAAELTRAPALRWVVTPTTGLDHLDLDALAAHGVEVIALRGHTGLLRTVHATAEHTWALLLAAARHLPAACRDVAAGHWRREPFLGTELHGRTLAIAGAGRIGRMVAGYGLAFGMQVLAHDTDPGQLDDLPAGVESVDVAALLARADVLTLHLPLERGTHGWLSRERIASLRPGAIVVNTARGELVDEGALLDALHTGHLAAVALDVVADDSAWPSAVPPGQPSVAALDAHPDLVITPHIGGYARDSVDATRAFVARRFADAVRTTRQERP